MRLAHKSLRKQRGLSFYKLMGSGAGEGFSTKPDWRVYCLLQVWDTKASATEFETSPWYQELLRRQKGVYHFELSPYHSKGTWNGLKPFELQPEQDFQYMAVLTRASIKLSYLRAFWRSVPAVSRIIKNQKSLLFQKGVGEWPLIEQATFSIWNREEAMRDFAYQQKEHRAVVQKTRKLNWYREEQFSRFGLLKHYGHWPDQTFSNLKKEQTE